MAYALDGRYIQDHFPGIGRYTYNLADALPRIAPDQNFIVLHNPALHNTRYDIPRLAQHPNLALRQLDIPTFSAAEQYRLSAVVAGYRLFHSPYYIKPFFLRVPSVVTIFDLLPLRYPEAIPAATRLFFLLAVWLAARSATRIIVPSTATRNDLVNLLHVPKEKIEAIPLAADARFQLQLTAEVGRVCEKYNLPERYVLYVGINKPHKNLKTLVEAWGRIQDRMVTLVVAGAWDSRYADLADSRSGKIQFIHNIPDADLPALYSGAAAFVLPSLYEGFGLPALEAMACGTPVICSNTSSLPEVAGDAALLFPPKDVQALTRALSQVLEDDSLHKDLQDRSLERAAQFSWDRTAQETLAVYKQVV